MGGGQDRGAAARENTAAARSGLRALHQPNVYSGALLVLLALMIVARGPITRSLGTATPPSAPTSSAPSWAGGVTLASIANRSDGTGVTQAPAATAAGERHVAQTHPARDPFAARLGVGGGLLKFVTPPAGWSLHRAHPAGTQRAANTAASHTSGAAASHRRGVAGGRPSGCPSATSAYSVRPGDSLWAIAARGTHSGSSADVAAQVRRIYNANRARIGANPSVVSVGTLLCLPGR